ncbi:MAG: beta-ketoacyl-ACP reductase [Candidatus Dormibacteraeota bacterium]|nr:beta-ketoacyl-ACP reductase [Candidatus Dormibacteraeota bacterium]
MIAVETVTERGVTPRLFEGRVAVVTGGTRGIGAAITAELARAGAHVAAGFNRDDTTANRLRDELTAAGGSISVHQGNVGVPEDCDRVIETVLAEYGRVDFLVNNAGLTQDKTVRRMSVDDWHTVMRVNISGAFYMIKAVLNHMLERGNGRIVNISSLIGQTGNIGQANYAASKAAMFGLSQSLALETAAKGITVNCVAPGFIGTEMVNAIPEKILQGIIDRVPVHRLGRPEEVARVVRFLLEDDSSYITGAVYSVNGGLF